MEKDLTVIFALIDGSGSMESMRQAVIDGFNEFITDQKKLPGNVLLSMVQFDSGWGANSRHSHHYNCTSSSLPSLRYREIYHLKNLREVEKLTLNSYKPDGGTPLLAAMTKAIDELGQDLSAIPEQHRPSKVVFLVVTDGQENSSDRLQFSKAGVASKVNHQIEKYDWQFVYIGANQDSFAEAGGMGIMTHSTANYAPTYDGMIHTMSSVSSSTASYRSGITNTVDLSGIIPAENSDDKS